MFARDSLLSAGLLLATLAAPALHGRSVWALGVQDAQAPASEAAELKQLQRACAELASEIKALGAGDGSSADGIQERVDELAAQAARHGLDWGAKLQQAFGDKLNFTLFRHAAAFREYDKAEPILREHDLTLNLAKLAWSRGWTHTRLSRFDQALEELATAEALYSQLGLQKTVAKIVLNRGAIHLSRAEYEEASLAYAEAEAVFESLNDAHSLAMVRLNQGMVLDLLGRYTAALEHFDEAAATYAAAGDDRELMAVLIERAGVYRKLGRFDDALRDLVPAQATAERVGDSLRQGKIVGITGGVYRDLGRVDEALGAYERSESVARRGGDEAALAATFRNRAHILSISDRFEEALGEYDKAEPLFEKLGMQNERASLIHNRACTLFDLGRYAEALEEFDRSGELWDRLGSASGLATVHKNRGGTLIRLERYDEALEELARAEELYLIQGRELQLATIATDRGVLHLRQGRQRAALADFVAATEGLEALLLAGVQGLGEGSSTGVRGRFEDLMNEGLRCVAESEEPSASELASAYRILQVLQGLGMAQIIAERGQPRSFDVPPELMAQLTEARRGLRVAREDFGDLAGERLGAEDRAIGRELAAARELCESRRLELSELVEKARVLDRKAFGVHFPRAAGLEEVRDLLQPGAALVEYALGEKNAFAFVLTHDGTSLLQLAPRERLTAAAAKLSGMLDPARGSKKPFESELERELRQLAELVLDPVLAVLPEEGVETLFIAPSGELCQVPFEALLTAEARDGAPQKEWPFLIAESAVAYVHSGTTLREMLLDRRAALPEAESLAFVAFAHPYYEEAEGLPAFGSESLAALRGSRRLAPLPRTADEVLEIARLFASAGQEMSRLEEVQDEVFLDDREALEGMGPVLGRNFALFLRLEAHEHALKTRPEVRRARILHLACHGTADTRSPQLSHLSLSQVGSLRAQVHEDGRLFLGELGELDLCCELLSLSACETNAGTLRPLEGITGLARAGLAAGAEAVLSTLWRVEDDAARRLMVAFYERWIRARVPRVQALAHAKRVAIERGIPIATWSAYVLWDAQAGE